jgi:hypothetical protein
MPRDNDLLSRVRAALARVRDDARALRTKAALKYWVDLAFAHNKAITATSRERR